MTVPLRAQGQRISRCRTSGSGSSATIAESGRVDRREQLEQLAEARDAVVGGQEVREDEAAVRGAGEDDAVAGSRPGERGERRGVRSISSPVPSTIVSTRLVTVTGTRELPLRPVPARRRRNRSSSCSAGTSLACSSTR